MCFCVQNKRRNCMWIECSSREQAFRSESVSQSFSRSASLSLPELIRQRQCVDYVCSRNSVWMPLIHSAERVSAKECVVENKSLGFVRWMTLCGVSYRPQRIFPITEHQKSHTRHAHTHALAPVRSPSEKHSNPKVEYRHCNTMRSKL